MGSVLIGFLKWTTTFLKGTATWLDESLMVAPLLLSLFAELAGLRVVIGAAWLAHGKNTEKMNRMGQFAAVVGGIWCPFAWDWVSLKWIPVFGIVGWCSFKVIVRSLNSRRRPSPEFGEKEDV